MVNLEVLSVPDYPEGLLVSLSKAVPAVRLERNEDGAGAKLGLVSQLRPGTTLVVCGEGFDERTVKIWANAECYFASWQNIASSADLAKRASTPAST